MKSNKVIKALAYLLTVILLAELMIPIQPAAAKESKKYLVIVEQKDGTYKSYNDLVYETSNNKLLIKAELTAKALV